MEPEDVEDGDELQPVLEQGGGYGDVKGILSLMSPRPSLAASVAETTARRSKAQVDVRDRPLKAPNVDRLSFLGLDVEMHLKAAGLAASGGDDGLQAEIGLSAGHHAPQRNFDARRHRAHRRT